MGKGGCIYILTNKKVLYTGVTPYLQSRVYEHKTRVHPKSFTAKYNVDWLVYYETFHSTEEAIESRIEKEKIRLD